jgi:hypothetical protein
MMWLLEKLKVESMERWGLKIQRIKSNRPYNGAVTVSIQYHVISLQNSFLVLIVT